MGPSAQNEASRNFLGDSQRYPMLHTCGYPCLPDATHPNFVLACRKPRRKVPVPRELNMELRVVWKNALPSIAQHISKCNDNLCKRVVDREVCVCVCLCSSIVEPVTCIP